MERCDNSLYIVHRCTNVRSWSLLVVEGGEWPSGGWGMTSGGTQQSTEAEKEDVRTSIYNCLY